MNYYTKKIFSIGYAYVRWDEIHKDKKCGRRQLSFALTLLTPYLFLDNDDDDDDGNDYDDAKEGNGPCERKKMRLGYYICNVT